MAPRRARTGIMTPSKPGHPRSPKDSLKRSKEVKYFYGKEYSAGHLGGRRQNIQRPRHHAPLFGSRKTKPRLEGALSISWSWCRFHCIASGTFFSSSGIFARQSFCLSLGEKTNRHPRITRGPLPLLPKAPLPKRRRPAMAPSLLLPSLRGAGESKSSLAWRTNPNFQIAY